MAERRLKRAPAQRHRPRHVWQVLGGLIAVVILWYATPAVLRRLEFFRIRRVEIAGTQSLAPAEILAALELDDRASVFDDLPAAGKELKSLPGVRSAAVRRRLPGTLEIVVEEAVPVALAPRGASLRMLDSSGSVLPFDPAATAPDLPIAVSVDANVARVLASVRASDPALYRRVEAAWRVQDDVILEVDAGRRLRFGPAVTAEDIRAVSAVAQDLARQGRSYAELDGRFDGQVIVRWVGA